ncbi:hypothetical protein SLA2020_170060 [Shorea laevis]
MSTRRIGSTIMEFSTDGQSLHWLRSIEYQGETKSCARAKAVENSPDSRNGDGQRVKISSSLRDYHALHSKFCITERKS